ncbi:MAG TPA: GNAT family N-acetyltransferase [Nitrospirota bacterium]|nr:GNAT family N-acetyltransferase [Nitrospirota bacterium]
MSAHESDKPEIIRVILKDGQTFKVRPISADDRQKLKDFFYRLSPQTRYFRFGHIKDHITDQELSYFTAVKAPDMYAYVGVTGEGSEEMIRAVGRWFLSPGQNIAEIAFVVEDNIQARGIGTALLEQLAEAALSYHIKKLVARVLTENVRMQRVFEESGFLVTKRFVEDAFEYTFDLENQEEFSKRQALREHLARSTAMRRMLYPKAIAVIGASRDSASVGGKVFRNLLYSNFSGALYPINPKAQAVNGVVCYPSIADVPGDVDLAVIVVPAKMVLDVVDACGRKSVWGVVIISAGFGESGSEGKDRQRQLREKIFSYGMRCIGPNCLGILNTDPMVNLNATFGPLNPPRGNLSISSHSGALGLALLDYVKSNNLGVAHFASIGNRIDVSSNDLLEFWEDDDNTKVILLYLETFGNARRFSRIARRISRKKPIIAVKSGRSDVGGRAASSHTGALAASDVAVDALFRQAGVIRVNKIVEMFNVAKLLAAQPLLRGPNVAILTNAGGPGVLAADAAVGWGLSVPVLPKETQEKLAQFLPKEAALANPVDTIASAPGEHFEKALRALLEEPSVDAIIVINIPLRDPEEIAAGIRRAMADSRGNKPVLASFMMSNAAEVNLRYNDGGLVPVYTFPEDAVQALALAWPYARHCREDEGRIVTFPDINEERAWKYLSDTGSLSKGKGWLTPETAVGLLRQYGIPVVDTRAAFSPEEAAKAAAEIGFPVAVKLRSTTLTHKTDVGGIALNLKTAEDVMTAYRGMQERLTAAGHGAAMEGVILQPMMKGGQEVIVGMSQDPLFGPLLMVGMGGVQVELTKDVAFSLHPLTDKDPDFMLKQLKGMPLLTGWRGSSMRDVDALKEVLLRFSAMIDDFTEIAEMEINPLMVFDKGKGCAVVDARILIK